MPKDKDIKGTIYLSAPLFAQVERRWNRELALALEERLPGVRVILPQDIRIHRRYNDPRNFPAMFRKCLEALDSARVVVAILDGPDADSGVAFEVGYARAKGKPIVGVRTDFRKNQDRGLNMMVGQALTRFCPVLSFNEHVGTLATEIVGKIRAVWGKAGAHDPRER